MGKARKAWVGLMVLACTLPSMARGQDTPLSDVGIAADVVYGHKDGMALTFDVLTPANSNGAAVLYMISGGWVSRWGPPEAFGRRSAAGLLAKGFTVFAVRHGSAPKYKAPKPRPT